MTVEDLIKQMNAIMDRDRSMYCHACHSPNVAIRDVRLHPDGIRYYCERDWLTVYNNRLAKVPNSTISRETQPYDVAFRLDDQNHFWPELRKVCVSAPSRYEAITLAANLLGIEWDNVFYACLITPGTVPTPATGAELPQPSSWWARTSDAAGVWHQVAPFSYEDGETRSYCGVVLPQHRLFSGWVQPEDRCARCEHSHKSF